MIVKIIACNAHKPDRRAIAKLLEEYGGLSSGDAAEQAGFLLEGSEIDLEIAEDHLSSAYRALRKLDIDYQIED